MGSPEDGRRRSGAEHENAVAMREGGGKGAVGGRLGCAMDVDARGRAGGGLLGWVEAGRRARMRTGPRAG
jgi:hypothetical protein